MINFLKKKKPNVKSIKIPTFNWNIREENKGLIQFVNKEETKALSVNFFELPPDIPSINDVNGLREFYRKRLLNSGGGIIEVDVIDLSGFKAVKNIFKFPQEPKGMTYLASLTIPFKDYSYVVKLQVPELGMTGMRDSMISSKLLAAGEISFADKKIENWFYYPYDESISEGLRMNKSEQEKYDVDFPDHPLSVTRKLLGQIIKEIQFEKELDKIARF